eukprot:Gb_28862 [translate_table: standard]
MASLITEKEIQSKCDPIIQDFFMKSLQIILQSRISSRRQTSLGKSSSSSSSSKGGMGGRQFNLALKDCPVPVDGPEVCNVDGFRSIVLDVLLVQLKHQQTGTDESSVLKHGKLDMMRRSVTSQQEDCKTVLERWVLQYLNCDEEQSVGKQTSGAGDVAVLYKSTMIMLRSLYCMTRLLPAYGLFQLSNSSASVNLFGITYRISPLPRPLSRGKNVQMKSHKFTPIKAPSGKICLSVDYCSVRASDFETPSQIRLPSIMIDYIRSPTTDAVKKLSYRGGTSLKINSGHCLPQTVSIPSSLPRYSCRGEKLNCHNCKTARFGNSYPQGPLQKSSCRRSFECINFLQEEHFHCIAEVHHSFISA